MKTNKNPIRKKTVVAEQGDAQDHRAGVMPSITMTTSSPATKELGRAYGCAWTLYQYEKHLEKLRAYAQSESRYMVWGYEICPDTGRPHLQGYVHWTNKRSLGAFSSTFGDCHVTAPNGTAKQNREYCLKIRPQDKKPNEKWEEFGELPVQGHRVDWQKAIADLRQNDVIDVIIEQPHLAPAQRALREIKAMYLKPLHRDVTVYVLYGPAGSGKSRWAYDHYPTLYKKPVGEWWDGYNGQKCVLLDDFYGWIKYHDLLHVCDRYPLQVPVKGGFVHAQWDTVVITSNEPPNRWYKDHGLTPALRRRIKKTFYVSVIDGTTHYQEEACFAQETSDATQTHYQT